MPSEVVFTNRAWSANASARCPQGSTRSPGNDSANASARSGVRLVTATVAPASSKAAAMARAAPPAPSSSAGPAAGSTPSARKLAR